MAYQCKSPVLFLVFNRPDVTARVFEAIRRVQPVELYVAADGPRADRKGEAALCQKVRKIAANVDWNCAVKTLFRDKNLGCGKAVSEAITWFFENVEEGIILEDDCLPYSSFFEYCDLMLKTYRNDDSVWSIAGTKFKCYPYSRSLLGYKSEIFFCWGWASWRNRWEHYTRDLNKLLPIEVFSSSLASRYWNRVIESLKEEKVDTWDYQFALLSVKHSKKNIVPPYSLVKNMGFNELSTHTQVAPRYYAEPRGSISLKQRSGIKHANVFDNIYFGMHHPLRLVRVVYLFLMYGIGVYEEIFSSVHSKQQE